MITRQHTKEANIGTPIELDFELASKSWLKNKLSTSNGCYKYICMGLTKKDLPCKKTPLCNSNYCKLHNQR